MIETFKSYLNNKSYYIIITNDTLYIKNYTFIKSINNDEILISINTKNYQIKGKNISLKRTEDKEILIEGEIESINLYD